MLREAFFKEKIYLQVIYVNIYTHGEYKDLSSVCGLITENLGLNIVIYFLRVEEDVQ